MKTTRRSHTKSRNGCIQCKLRRIKCDEKYPQCSHSASSSQTLESPITSSSQSTSSIPSKLLGEPLALPITPSGLHVGDLELLHHYSTITYRTLPAVCGPDLHDLWQSQVVQLGLRHEFLLRGILAVSALHLAYLHPHRRESLALRADAHHSTALEIFRDVLNHVDQSNCVAIFAFSCFIVVLAFATPRRTESNDFEKDIFDWFHMIRGCNSVLQTQWETVSSSFLAPLVRKGMAHEAAGPHQTSDFDRVTGLLQLCASARLAQDRENTNAYALAIHELLNTYTQVSIRMRRKEDFIPTIFVWPISIPQRYLDMLRDRQPEAMIILAYYSALLQHIDNQWYMCGWARFLVAEIDAALSEEWHEWLLWPKEVTGFSVA
ncbi:C6 zinc finger protein [Talaromyces proteolyticus]|uniref:C6 zinc finger protein n=1 Tax=Talaromyces proteolyticus TaxID=1131652 RepID=A0AAD4KKQ9_9EURO|nr:C6 zinc finger protein [Talaromyces proteolyticus]KAH8695043.1 C6 zinc finger protein [Talaromyces proteolyticus]